MNTRYGRDYIPCPDGYLLDPTSLLADAHHALNHYLVRVEEVGWKAAGKELNTLRDKHLKLRIWKALLQRLEWLRTNNPDGSCLGCLRDLTSSIEKWKLVPSEADLLEILPTTGKLAGWVMSYTPMPHLMAYVEEHGLTPTLSAAIRAFGASVRERGLHVNQMSYQLFNSRLDMLTWWDEWTEVDPKRCWSEQIRADFRAMRGTKRENWRRLLHSIQGDEGVRPAPKWLRSAEAQIQAIGPAEFRTCVVRWFEPLRRGRTQRLSREGSFILRSFIWLSVSLNDGSLIARVTEICEVDFKPKENGEKVVRAVAEALGREEPAAKRPTPALSLDALAAHALATMLNPATCTCAPPRVAERVWIDGLIVHICGDLDTYRMHVSTGAIIRERDGRRVHATVEDVMPVTIKDRDVGGVAEMLAQILILAEDAKHVHAVTTTPE
jgi:hypothetical protein